MTCSFSVWAAIISFAAFLQKYWADNQVSCTISFNKEESDQIKYILDYFQYQLKGISFLPITEKGTYPQMPYKGITEQEYIKRIETLKPIKLKNIHGEEADIEKYCSNDKCSLTL